MARYTENGKRRKVLRSNQCYRMVSLYRTSPSVVTALAAPVLAALQSVAAPDGFVYGDSFREAVDHKFSLAALASAYAIASVDKHHPCVTRLISAAFAA